MDFGEKRVGLAVSDETGHVILPIGTILRKSDHQAISDISALARERDVTAFVTGLPLKEDGSEGPTARRARNFARRLHEGTGLPVHMQDERFTTAEATSRLRGDLQHSPRADRDSLAAALILEDFLASVLPGQNVGDGR